MDNKNKKLILIIGAILVIAGIAYYATTNTGEKPAEEITEETPKDPAEEATDEAVEGEKEDGQETTEEEEEAKEKPFYNESLVGIPHLEDQKLVQNSMEEQGNKNTKGYLSYKVESTDKTIEEVTEYFMKNTDTEIWEIEKLESNDENSQQLIYDSKDEMVKSTTLVVIIKTEDDLIINLTSYYDNTKLTNEGKEGGK